MEEADQWAEWEEWTSQKVCYASLVWRAPGGADAAWGGKCSRCGLASYTSREAQCAHWKVHKQVCGKPDLARVGAMDAAQCVAALQPMVIGSLGKDSAAVIYRLGVLLKSGEVEGAEGVGIAIHTLARAFGPDEGRMAAAHARLWAVPGMPQLLLREPHLAPRTLAVEGGHAAQLAAVRATTGWQGVHHYAWLTYNLLVRSAVGHVAHSAAGVHDGQGRLRAAPFALAAAERAIALFCDPRVRRECGDPLAPAPSLLLTYTMHQLMGQAAAALSPERELVELSVARSVAKLLLSGAAQACYDELFEGDSGMYCVKFLELAAIADDAWDFLHAELAAAQRSRAAPVARQLARLGLASVAFLARG